MTVLLLGNSVFSLILKAFLLSFRFSMIKKGKKNSKKIQNS